jgi:hypothetical protein
MKYKFRAECDHDALTFRDNTIGQTDNFEFFPMDIDGIKIPDVEVIFESELTLEEILEEMSNVMDGHIMCRTVKPIEEYTGEEVFDEEDVMHDECMNCGSIWGPGSEEWQFQQCDTCGWMPGQPTDDESGDDEFDDMDDDDFDGHLLPIDLYTLTFFAKTRTGIIADDFDNTPQTERINIAHLVSLSNMKEFKWPLPGETVVGKYAVVTMCNDDKYYIDNKSYSDLMHFLAQLKPNIFL